jgi:hypothetical protein
MLPVNGIPKLVIAKEDVAACPTVQLLIPGIWMVRFESIVIAPSDTV